MAAEQPNVVLMLADNVGYGDIGAFAGGEVRGIPTPNIDQQASELVKINRGEPGLTAKYPWLVAYTFGLLHGFGFAGALSQVGLPQNEIPLALLMFNVGVELGQLMFIVVMLVLIRALHRIRHSWPQWVYQLPAYGIGSMAAFWFVERVSGFLN